jgi:2-hydroxycyclohexanecarboxyl-CoA dehydrogenase
MAERTSLRGRTAVVTGGGSGIGRASCLQLARDGAKVGVWDLSADAANETVGLIEAEGGTAKAFVGDAAERSSIENILAEIRSALGPILILVNNAGISQFKEFLDVTEDDFDRVFRINVKGPFVLTQLVAPDMLAANWGRIIFISSSSAQTGTRLQPHYSSSKGAIISLTRSLAETFAADGITVNNVPPGFIDTPMLRGVDLDVDKVAQLSPMKRPGKPEELAAAVGFLASEAAGYITGQTLGVNGGRVVS